MLRHTKYVLTQSRNYYPVLSRRVRGIKHRGEKRKEPCAIPDAGLHQFKRRRPPTLPHCIAVPSAQTGLTSLFGMGRGGTPTQ